MLQKFSFEGFLNDLEKGNVLVDFDARSGHNHGTKFRMRQNCLVNLYETVTDRDYKHLPVTATAGCSICGSNHCLIATKVKAGAEPFTCNTLANAHGRVKC